MDINVNEIYKSYKDLDQKEVTLKGWIRTIRASKDFGFIELNDGTNFQNIQIVIGKESLDNFEEVSKYSISSGIEVSGVLVLTPDMKQDFEVQASLIKLWAASDSDYPLQKKRHSFEYLREIAHLRPRGNTFNAVFRLRSLTAFAIHEFFQNRDFVYVNTPLITASDCEGAGEMFRVTTMDMNNPLRGDDGKINYGEDFFGTESFLTVSGQLQGEAFALAFKNIYTFGPTFRAENSNTARHAAEFWMIEPEIAFADLKDDMLLAEDMMKYIINNALNKAENELAFFNQFVDKGLINRLEGIVKNEFERVSYTDAIKILEKAPVSFEYPVSFGLDLQTEHERYLTENYFKKPVFVTDYPKDIKAFYMRLNDDEKTVAAVDLLVPEVGEIIGGSQREERYDILDRRAKECSVDLSHIDWYKDLRKYGGVKHAGFGLGFERAIMYLSGMKNIRDVVPFPRTVKNAKF